ncbi:MAG: hypothetical protein P8Q48_25420 [Paracoccaceae bacterium]|nr:hypothetical protein [Paracoccaceae bacterium]MDG1373534.1 hypothetical protein [Paracoccaceae bacterium]
MNVISLCVVAIIACSSLAACEATLQGAPTESFAKLDPDAEKPELANLIVSTTLEASRIKAPVEGGTTKRQRNEIIFARMAEIDALYFEYERALSTEPREYNFALALAGLAIGGAGSIASEGASQILSAASAGLTGARDAFQKEVLIERTTQAFVSQMRAARDLEKQNILLKLTASSETYPLQAAVSDLESYRQAGTLTGALSGIADSAAENERVQRDKANEVEASILKANFGQNEASDRISKYLNAEGNPANKTARFDKVRAVYAIQPQAVRKECAGGDADDRRGLLFALYSNTDKSACALIANEILERLIIEKEISQ